MLLWLRIKHYAIEQTPMSVGPSIRRLYTSVLRRYRLTGRRVYIYHICGLVPRSISSTYRKQRRSLRNFSSGWEKKWAAQSGVHRPGRRRCAPGDSAIELSFYWRYHFCLSVCMIGCLYEWLSVWLLGCLSFSLFFTRFVIYRVNSLVSVMW